MALPHMASSNQQQFKIGYIPWWSFPKNELRVHSNNNTWWNIAKNVGPNEHSALFPRLSLPDRQTEPNKSLMVPKEKRTHNNQSTRKRVKEHKAKEKVPAHRGWSSHHQTPPKRKDRDMGLYGIPMSTFRVKGQNLFNTIQVICHPSACCPWERSVAENGKKICDLAEPGK
jgi:hypothetical protein